ncbi:hypothetical protein [Orenia marismortui]|uniref:Uncharacterized protein n=1 Tax=Orenia marismortui TaxID=46469 RepID=A0A4R8HI21_9FIRM|nr:hypothetical protein [Orenia marismortui]TDX59128.1 hypothetical protein C7959_10114 [Orenia marismortui]
MTNFHTRQNNNYGKEIGFKELTNILNNLLPEKGYGILLDCIIPQIRNMSYPHGVSKPIPFLRAVNLEESFMILMVEYKLYVPGSENDEELALEITKPDFHIFKKENEVNFVYKDDKVITLKLHNSFDFAYELDDDDLIPTLSFVEWVSSPFI